MFSPCPVDETIGLLLTLNFVKVFLALLYHFRAANLIPRFLFFLSRYVLINTYDQLQIPSSSKSAPSHAGGGGGDRLLGRRVMRK